MELATNPGFIVVVNHEEQYSIWAHQRELPLGWTRVGIPREWLAAHRSDMTHAVAFDEATCLDFIDAIWGDIRPLSVRLALQSDE